MKKHHNLLKQLIQDTFKLPENIDLDLANSMVLAPEIKFGHLAFGVFPLAKQLKTNPNALATQLLKSQSPNGDYSLEQQGPYLNFTFSAETLCSLVLRPILDGSFFQRKILDESFVQQGVMLEYSQPNTHKELHVGHMRNLSYGNALVKMYQYGQVPIHTSTFPGDVGTHVAKCLYYLKNYFQGEIPNTNRGAFLGKIYNQSEILLGEKPEIASEFSEILQQIEKKSGEYFELWKKTRQWSIELMEEVYAWAKVSFDKWYWESDVDSESIVRVKNLCAQGLLIESQGAIGADLKEDNLGFCMLIKSDGNGLYATKDVELAFRKAKDFSFTKSIYVVDKRQSHHFAQVFKVLEKIQYPKDIQLIHLAYDFVELTTGAMSSRKGNIVPIMELIAQMKRHIQENYLSKYLGIWETQKIEETSNIIAASAIKYGMICTDSQKKIVFSMEEWLKIEGNCGPYLLYIVARIQSLLSKQNIQVETLEQNFIKEFTHPLEEELVIKLSLFNDVMVHSIVEYRPSYLCTYLYELGQLYNAFYVQCPIAKADKKEVAQWRCTLSYCVLRCMQQGLSNLGIEYVDQM